jgi:hypothetical protein
MYTPELLAWYYIAGGTQITYPVEDVWDSTYFDFAKSDFDEGKERKNLLMLYQMQNEHYITKLMPLP